MFGWRDIAKNLVKAGALIALLSIVACGGTPPPLPPPAATSPTGGVYYGGCGAVAGGMPLNNSNTPYAGMMVPSSSGYNYGDSMQLNLFYSTSYDADNFIKSVVGTANMNLPSLTSLNSFPTPNQQTTFCASSVALQGGTPNPGEFNSQNLAIQITLTGMVQVPLLSPYSGYPGGYSPTSGSYGSLGQEEVTVNIGTAGDCGAYLSQDRVVGCVDVIIGPQSSGTIIRYYAQ